MILIKIITVREMHVIKFIFPTREHCSWCVCTHRVTIVVFYEISSRTQPPYKYYRRPSGIRSDLAISYNNNHRISIPTPNLRKKSWHPRAYHFQPARLISPAWKNVRTMGRNMSSATQQPNRAQGRWMKSNSILYRHNKNLSLTLETGWVIDETGVGCYLGILKTMIQTPTIWKPNHLYRIVLHTMANAWKQQHWSLNKQKLMNISQEVH